MCVHELLIVVQNNSQWEEKIQERKKNCNLLYDPVIDNRVYVLIKITIGSNLKPRSYGNVRF